MPEKLKIYVGYTHTHSPESFREQIQTLKESLVKEGYEVIDQHGVSGENAYYRDIEYAIGQCDLFVAVCDHYATTLGLQIGAAAWLYRKPTLLFAYVGTSIAPVLADLQGAVPAFGLYRYKDVSSIVGKINKYTELGRLCV